MYKNNKYNKNEGSFSAQLKLFRPSFVSVKNYIMKSESYLNSAQKYSYDSNFSSKSPKNQKLPVNNNNCNNFNSKSSNNNSIPLIDDLQARSDTQNCRELFEIFLQQYPEHKRNQEKNLTNFKVKKIKNKEKDVFHLPEEFTVVSCPGRVNLIGGHTDYCNGFVFPLAIGLKTYVLGYGCWKVILLEIIVILKWSVKMKEWYLGSLPPHTDNT